MNKGKTYRIALMGLLFALALVLSVAEDVLTPSGLMAGMKLGLSNIVTMYCLFFLGVPSAAALVLLKSLFALLTRGATAALLAGCGGAFSVLLMFLLLHLSGGKASFLLLSVCGAVGHNMAQLAAACFLMQTALTVYYLPVLLLSGIAAGVLTGILLRVILPALQGLHIYRDSIKATTISERGTKEHENETQFH